MTTMTNADDTLTIALQAMIGDLPVAKGWHTDPLGLHDLRWHDGSDWTEHVTHFGPSPCTACNPTAISN